MDVPQKPIIKKIEHLTQGDLETLRDQVFYYIEFMEEVKNGRPSDKQDDFSHWVFEKALELFCGDDVWDSYINKVLI